MKLGKVALKLRLNNNTRFEQRIFGAADIATLKDATLTEDMAFVIPLNDSAPPNTGDNHINQLVTEQFGVIVALKADIKQSDKTHLIPMDLIHNVRDEINSQILGWKIPDTDDDTSNYEGLIYYAGGTLIDINRAWVWWQYAYATTLRFCSPENTADEGTSELPAFLRAYAQYVLNPDDDFSMGGRSLPIPSNETDAEQLVE